MVLARFLPHDEQFFTFFSEGAANAVEAAKLLAAVIELGPETERQVSGYATWSTRATRSPTASFAPSIRPLLPPSTARTFAPWPAASTTSLTI